MDGWASTGARWSRFPPSKTRLGRPAFIDSNSKDGQEAKDGDPVTLTLDASLQYTIEEELRSAVRKTGARAGSVIVMNAANGEVLAMANEPTFSPNDHKAGADRRRNRALTDGYEPGSTDESRFYWHRPFLTE